MITTYPKLYKRDTTGAIRVWYVELTGDDVEASYRTVSSKEGGQEVRSGWKLAEAKNVGKKNETTSLTQAQSEVESMYTKQCDRGYFRDVKDVDTFTKFKPMLANDYTKLKKPLKFPVYSQPKLDGIRCIARVDGLWTRAGKRIVSCPHIEEELSSLFAVYPDYVLDGELYNHDLKDNFNKITSLVRKTKPTEEDIAECRDMVQYHCYDAIPPAEGDQLFPARHENLFAHLRDVEYTKKVMTFHVPDQELLDDAYKIYLKHGYEGQMVRLPGEYENKRSKLLLKRKEFYTDEFPVAGIEEGKGTWAGYIKIFHVEYEPGKVCGAGVRGSMDQLKVGMEKPDWCTLRWFEKTPDGVPRFPVVIDWGYGERED